MKIGILLPEVEMVAMTKRLVEENKIDVAYMKAIHSVDAVNEARLAVEAGAHILIARGYQAKLIKQYTDIPLVEMKFHAQEIGLLVKKAKNIVKKERPVVGMIAFDNTLGNLDYIENLFEVKLVILYMRKIDEAERLVQELIRKRADVVIGGEVVCGTAEKMGLPSLFIQATEESVLTAMEEAKNMAFAAEIEKRNAAQFETMLDTSFSGIIKVNADRNIIVVNKLVENLIGRNKEDVVGLHLEDVFPQIDMNLVNHILQGESESYSTSISIRNKVWMLMIAPIQYDDKITGAILSIHKVTEISRSGENSRMDMRLYGFSARASFHDIYTMNRNMREMLEDAKMFALSDSPILLYGGTGSETQMVAEAIHNNSNRKGGPFVQIDMTGINPEQQMEELFRRTAIESNGEHNSNKGALLKANYGTLFIKGAEYMGLRAQKQLIRTVVPKINMRSDAQSMEMLDVRLIICAKRNLQPLVWEHSFSEELYYRLQGLTLTIPDLNDRPEDLVLYFDSELVHFEGKYNKRLKVTEGGYNKLKELHWNGNRIQLRSFCERLVISAQKRSVDEVLIQKVYDALYPQIRLENGQHQVVIYKSPENQELTQLLEKHRGNRNKVAKELGISTTTLWRRMKKYGVEAKYNN